MNSGYGWSFYGSPTKLTDTTEIHVIGSSNWVTIKPLPKPYFQISSFKVGNVVYGTGK